MEESTTKEKILKSVRNALINKTDNPFKNIDFNSDLFKAQKEVPEVEFALKLNESGGTFFYCENEVSFIENLQALMAQQGWEELTSSDTQLINLLSGAGVTISTPDKKVGFNVSITRCEFLISRFGSVMVSSALAGRNLYVGAETHLVVAKASQVVREIKDSLSALKIKYAGQFPSQVTMITGPSRTADIEKTLIMGAHGSKNLVVFMIDDA
jgi:L-lactate dehydrogenase complex protein LldG